MIYNGINFYEVNKDKTEAEFIAHEKHTGLSDKELKEAYALLNPKKKKDPPVNTGAAPKQGE